MIILQDSPSPPPQQGRSQRALKDHSGSSSSGSSASKRTSSKKSKSGKAAAAFKVWCSRCQNFKIMRVSARKYGGWGGGQVLYSAGLDLRGVFFGLMSINHSIGFVRMDFFPSLHLWLFLLEKRFLFSVWNLLNQSRYSLLILICIKDAPCFYQMRSGKYLGYLAFSYDVCHFCNGYLWSYIRLIQLTILNKILG